MRSEGEARRSEGGRGGSEGAAGQAWPPGAQCAGGALFAELADGVLQKRLAENRPIGMPMSIGREEPTSTHLQRPRLHDVAAQHARVADEVAQRALQRGREGVWPANVSNCAGPDTHRAV